MLLNETFSVIFKHRAYVLTSFTQFFESYMHGIEFDAHSKAKC